MRGMLVCSHKWDFMALCASIYPLPQSQLLLRGFIPAKTSPCSAATIGPRITKLKQI